MGTIRRSQLLSQLLRKIEKYIKKCDIKVELTRTIYPFDIQIESAMFSLRAWFTSQGTDWQHSIILGTNNALRGSAVRALMTLASYRTNTSSKVVPGCKTML